MPPGGVPETEITLAVLQETVRAQGEETRRALEALRATISDVAQRIGSDHDRITRLEGSLCTEVERAGGEHKRLFTLTDGLAEDIARLASRDRLEAIALLAASVLAAIIGSVVK